MILRLWRTLLVKRSLIAGINIVAIRLFGSLLSLLVTLALTQTVGAAGLGIYALLFSFIQLAQVPLTQGWNRLLLRTAAQGFARNNLAETRGMWIRCNQFAFLLAPPVTIAVMLLFWSSPATQTYHSPMLIAIVVAGVLLFDGLSGPRFALVRAFDRPLLGQIPDVIVRPLVQVAVIGGVFWHSGSLDLNQSFISLVVAAGMAMAVGAIIYARVVPRKFVDQEPIYSTLTWAKVAAVMGANSVVLMLNATLSLMILGYLASAEAVGQFRVAIQISQFAGLTYVALNLIASQKFAYLGERGDRNAIASLGTLYSRLAFLASLAALCVIYFLGDFLFEQIFGVAFVAAVLIALVLIAGECVNSAVGMSGALLVMNNRENLVLKCTAVALLANAIACLVLVPTKGAIGAAIGALIAMLGRNLATWYFARTLTGIDTSIIGLPPKQGFDPL